VYQSFRNVTTISCKLLSWKMCWHHHSEQFEVLHYMFIYIYQIPQVCVEKCRTLVTCRLLKNAKWYFMVNIR
jgi:hypothetical protein